MRTHYLGIGVMSGTSHDGIDLAACRFHHADGQWHYDLLAAETVPYSPDWRSRLLALPHAPAEDFAKTHTDLGHLIGMAVRQFALANGLRPDFVASHGHTIFHQPTRHFTAQIGCGETLVTHLHCPLVCDFRPRDVARGGQGAPLVPFSQHALFPDTGLFLNLGGIANLTVLAQRAGLDPARQYDAWAKPGWQFMAYDVCAANMVLNHLATQHNPQWAYDPEGQLAASGELDPALLARLEGLDFYHNHPPRSLGREYALSHILPLLERTPLPLPDKAHTYGMHIVLRLLAELDRFQLRNQPLLVTGGGAHNTWLMAQLDKGLAERGITRIALDAQLINFAEALHFAFLGLMALLRQPNVLAEGTGARSAGTLGAIHLPESYTQPLL